VIDALGRPGRILLLGGTSEIGTAILAALQPTAVVLAGRPGPALDAAVESWAGRGVDARAVAFDALNPQEHAAAVAEAWRDGDVDLVVLAAGVLGDQQALLDDPAAAAAVAQANYAGPVAALVATADAMRAQGHGTVVVLSSVAGLRPRVSNYVYGSTKAGLDAFAVGLGEDLRGSGVRVLVVRPGFVRSKMTEGLPDAPLAVDPDDVAATVVKALAGRARIVYAPAAMRPVMAALRLVPQPIFRRLPL
jgi:decaprenylphospho-beta-D-erythro-pentofuranosid-2-ulose 2-reductase